MTELTLLASYPKSGNTWVRAFVTSLLQGGGAVDINALIGFGAADRLYIDDALQVETSYLLPEEIARHRAAAIRLRFEGKQGPILLKTHDAWLSFPGTDALPFAADQIGAVIFLIRDPRDVAISMAHHSGSSIDTAIAQMADIGRTIAKSETGLNVLIAQHLSSWSAHALSWLNASLPLSVFRYEDLLTEPMRGFSEIARSAGLPDDAERVGQAIAATQFEVLQDAERRSGFGERTLGVPDLFFRQGKARTWRDRLSSEQAERIAGDHATVMRQFGYLP